MTIRFDLGHDLDLEFSRSNMNLLYQPKVVRLPRNEKKASIELQASNVTNGFDLDLCSLKVKCDLDL